MQWPNATVGRKDTTGIQDVRLRGATGARRQADPGRIRRPDQQVRQVSEADPFAVAGAATMLPIGLDLPCTQDPELFFAESPQDVEQTKAMCRGCRARIACLTGALEREEPWGIWGGELLMRGAIVPRKRPRGRPRKTEVAA